MVDIDDRWTINGTSAVLLMNELLRVVVLPEAGGNVFSFEYRPKAHEWLWHNRRIGPAPAPFGSNFDNNWFGGADVLFPTCEPATWGAETIPDSGEWWSAPWETSLERDENGATLALTAGGRVLPTEAKRTLRIEDGSPELELGFEITNVGNAPVPFLLGFHPGLSIRAGYVIDLPQGTAKVAHSSGPRLGATGLEYRWPTLADERGTQHDMRDVPPLEANVFGGHYFTPDSGDVWWALRDPDRSIGIAVVAPESDFQGLWMWMVYGGWRGYHHVALEPWTGFPIALDEAIRSGGARWLEPGQTFSTEMRMVAFESSTPVTELTMRTPAKDFGRER